MPESASSFDEALIDAREFTAAFAKFVVGRLVRISDSDRDHRLVREAVNVSDVRVYEILEVLTDPNVGLRADEPASGGSDETQSQQRPKERHGADTTSLRASCVNTDARRPQRPWHGRQRVTKFIGANWRCGATRRGDTMLNRERRAAADLTARRAALPATEAVASFDLVGETSPLARVA